MTPQEFSKLVPGNIIQNLGSGNGYIVIENLGTFGIVCVKSLVAMSPSEWEKVNLK